MVVKKKIVSTGSAEGAPKTDAPKTNEQKTEFGLKLVNT